jgi:hypothetical protein
MTTAKRAAEGIALHEGEYESTKRHRKLPNGPTEDDEPGATPVSLLPFTDKDSTRTNYVCLSEFAPTVCLQQPNAQEEDGVRNRSPGHSLDQFPEQNVTANVDGIGHAGSVIDVKMVCYGMVWFPLLQA